jgi:hypothetical protein
MFTKKKVEFKTEAELQKYIDKKINSTIHSLTSQFNEVARMRNDKHNAEEQRLHERIVHLEKFLGIQFSTETTTGYKKVKKSKK